MTEIPADFPRQAPLASIAGVQPKLTMIRTADGRYVQGQTDDELRARYDMCADLVDQLVRYCEKKARERPEWSQDELLRKVDTSVRSKGWDVSSEELNWVMARMRERVTAPGS